MTNSNQILIITNSDFGKRSTMGYRAYQISKHGENVTSLCRSNHSNIENTIEIGNLFTIYARSLQFLIKVIGKNRFYDLLREQELRIFRWWVKRHLRKDKYQIIHFFIQDKKLFEYAKLFKKTIITEAFTHPYMLNQLSSEYRLEFNYSLKENLGIVEAYRLADIIISPSQWVTKSLKLDNLLDINKIRDVKYGVDLVAEEIDDAVLEEFKSTKILFVGGLKLSKGIEDLVKAFCLLDSSSFELHLYGRKFPLPSNLERIIENNPNIYYHGFIDEPREIYADKQIYILPSYHEGSSKTTFEAMSFGIPVICTQNSGSIVRHKENGMIIPVNSPSKIAESIIELTSDKNLYNSIKERALYEIREYTWEDYASEVLSIYEKF